MNGIHSAVVAAVIVTASLASNLLAIVTVGPARTETGALARWKVLAGPTKNGLVAVGLDAWDGFGTTVTATAPGAKFAAVVALDAKGHVLGRSPTVAVTG